MNKEEVKHICRRCGRRLKSLDSQKLGMGPVCYAKWLAESGQKRLFNYPLYNLIKNLYNKLWRPP